MILLRKSINFFLVVFLLTPISLLKGNNTDVRFSQITINDGLSLSSVYCIFQDSKGFIWFGTEDGLNKFDGKKFTVYRPIAHEQNCISYKWIELIHEDKHGILWFGSQGGLTRFDPSSERFNQYKSSFSAPRQLSNDTITAIEQVSENYLLVGTLGGLDRINLQTLDCTPFTSENFSVSNAITCIEPIDKESYVFADSKGIYQVNNSSGTVCEVILEDPIQVSELLCEEERVWIGTESGIYFYDTRGYSEASGRIYAQKLSTTASIEVEHLLLDEKSTLWISSPDGLYKAEGSERAALVIPSQKISHSLALISATNLLRDETGSIWFTTHGDGIYRIDKKTGEIDNYKNNPCDAESLCENSINCIFQDQSGSIWLGTFGAGISVYSPYTQKFKLLRHDPISSNTLASNFVWSIFEDHKGHIWIGSNDKGASVYLPESKKYLHFDHDPENPHSLSHSSVRKIYEDSKGTIWLGTDGGGLNKYNEKTHSFSHYSYDENNPNSISDNSVRVIYEDTEEVLWIGTRNGLNRFDRKKDSFKRYMHSPENEYSISHNFVYSAIYDDGQNNLWMGTYGGGLNKFNREMGKFEHFRYNPNNSSSLSDDIVFSIIEDQRGIFWIGTNSGLNRFNPKNGQFSRFGLEQGLPNEVIYGILPDDDWNLWLSTNYGICRFNPKDSTTINFDFTHGLQSNEFNGGAFHRGKSGHIYFGGVYGLNIIDPEIIDVHKDNSKIIFSRLEILGRDVKTLPSELNKKDYNRVIKDSIDYYIPVNIAYAEAIVLDYDIRYFSLEFVDLGNINSRNTNYAYMMEGLDENWQNSGKRNYVSYANMQAGKYRLKVRSQKQDGSWNKSEAAIDIIITPPFWKTWWFIAFQIVIALAIAYSIYRYLIKLKTYRILKIQNERINNINKKLVKSEQNLKLINATKDKFFSIIAHDLKNPFTSLLTISEVMDANYDSFEEGEKKASFSRIKQSVKQIYNLLENLLTWSRTQSGRIPFEPTKFNLSKLLTENYNLYLLSADKKKIKLNSNFQDEIEVVADRDMINAVVRNLLNNALKFTPTGKSVEIGTTVSANEVEIYIKDEGTGISDENMQKLFRIDQKVKTTGTAGEKGTGLGLIICKEFIEKNNGRIKVNTKLQEGSIFSISLPN